MGSGLEVWRSSDIEILVGAVPWFAEMLVSVPEDVVIRASRVQRRGGAAVVTLRGDGESRLQSIFDQLKREGWTRSGTITWRRSAPGSAAAPSAVPDHLVPAGSFCRGDASLVVWKARDTAEGLDLKVSFTNGSLACREQGPGAIRRNTSLADPGPSPSVVDDLAVQTLLEIPVPSKGKLSYAFGSRNDSWSEWFVLVHTTSSIAADLAYYEAQLAERGWAARDRREGPGIAHASFDLVAEGASRRAVLTITEDVTVKELKTLALRFDSAPK